MVTTKTEETYKEVKDMKFPKKLIIPAIILVIALAAVSACVTTIPAGHTGVVTTFGKVSDTVLQEGLNIKMPWQQIHKINNQITKLEVSTQAFSKDLQTVSTVVAVEFRVDKSKSYSIYKEVGENYKDVLITPAVNEVLKSISSKYTAEESVTNRAVISEGIVAELNKKLNSIGITIADVNIIDFDFSEAYISAIENKQVAEQELLKAKTEAEKKKVEAQGEADALMIQAKAEAEANQILSKSLTPNLVEYKKIEKWDGKMPYATGSNAIIDFSGMTSEKTE